MNQFFTTNICKFAVKKLKSTANPQINITGIISAISKKICFYDLMYRQIWVDISKVQHPLTKFLCCRTIISQRCCYSYSKLTEVGTNNIISKAQRNKAQRSFQPAKAQRKMRNLIFLLSEAQRNFRNELFDSVEAQRNSAIAERYFRTKLKRNLTSAIEISQHNANTAFFVILD